MSISPEHFWELFKQSGLASEQRIHQWQAQCASVIELKGANAVAQWLVDKAVISNYHAEVLLNELPGPFVFGDYVVIRRSPLAGPMASFTAMHRLSRFQVTLTFLDETQSPSPADGAAFVEWMQRHLAIEHPFLTDCYQLVELPDYKFAVTEAISKRRLSHGLTSGQFDSFPPLSISTASQWSHQLMQAVEHLHHCNAVLGTIHPDHISITGGTARLIRQPMATTVTATADDDRRDLLQLIATMMRRVSEADFDHQVWDTINWENADQFTTALRRLLPPAPSFDSPHSDSPHSESPLADSTSGGDSKQRFLVAINRAQESDSPVTAAPQFELPTSTSIDALPQLAVADPGIRYPSRRSPWPLVMTVVSLILCGVFVGRSLYRSVQEAQLAAHSATATETDTVTNRSFSHSVDESPSAAGASTATSVRYQPTADDGQLLWLPPTEGQAISLEYAPDSTRCFIHIRPAELIKLEEGRRVIRAFGLGLQSAVSRLEIQVGIPLTDIDRLLLCIAPNDDGRAEIVSIVQLPDASPARLPTPPANHENLACGQYWETEGLGRLLCDSPRRLVVGSPAEIRKIANRASPKPLLQREMESLRQTTDADQHWTIMTSWTYLLASAREDLAPRYQRIPQWLDQFLGDDLRAGSFSGHLTQNEYFAELRVEASTDARRRLLRELPIKMQQLSVAVQPLVSPNRDNANWQPLAMRLPEMLTFVAEHTRYQAESRQLVVNTALPPTAAHNLLLASEFVLDQSTTANVQTGKPRNTMTLEQLLNTPLDFALEQQSLQSAISLLARQVNQSLHPANKFVITIDGTALQREGITRNQQIDDYHSSDSTVAEHLTRLVVMANPSTNAKGPADPDQRLVWLQRTEPVTEGPVMPAILITTRWAANESQNPLPQVFRHP